MTHITKNTLLSPVLFAIQVLGIKPFRYQAEFLEDESPNIIFIGGRQIGKSTMLAIKALWNAFVKPNEDILILAPTFKQSKIVYDRIVEMIQRTDFVSRHIVRLTLEETRFDNGSSIRSLTTGQTGENVRGYSATMIFFDEAAQIPDKVFSAIEPAMAVRGRQLILSGTPRGTRGYFYTSFSENKITKRWKVYRVPSSMSPLISKEYLEEQRRVMTEADYKQEFETEFIDEVGLFYPYELVYSCSEDYEYSLEPEDGYEYYIGADISRTGEDETAIVIVAVPEDESKKIKVVWEETLSYPDLTVIASEIINKATEIGASKVFIDTIGVGAGVYDICKKELGSRATEVQLIGQRRETAYSNLKVLMEKKRIVLNVNDDKMRLEFNSYRVADSTAGGFHIRKDRYSHEDLIDALVLAITGITNQQRFLVFEGFDELGTVFQQYTIQNLTKELKSPIGVPSSQADRLPKKIVFYDEETHKYYDINGNECDAP